MRLVKFFVKCFCSLFLLIVGLDPAQSTKGIQMRIDNSPVRIFGQIHWTKQCAGSRFVQPKTKQLCTLILKFVELDNQLVLSTMPRLKSTMKINMPYAWWRFADQFHHHASLPCSFCALFPHFMLVFFSIPVLWEHICILNVRLGGETDQQNVIMHKSYCIWCWTSVCNGRVEYSSSSWAPTNLGRKIVNAKMRFHRSFFLFKCLHDISDFNFNLVGRSCLHNYNTRARSKTNKP